ncbi:MAG: hypothetical protein EOO98_02775 [Pedobacter sp.]|nr:MAG: hypothetical protein EOO98_02775 [Pedobacter sp.]
MDEFRRCRRTYIVNSDHIYTLHTNKSQRFTIYLRNCYPLNFYTFVIRTGIIIFTCINNTLFQIFAHVCYQSTCICIYNAHASATCSIKFVIIAIAVDIAKCFGYR